MSVTPSPIVFAVPGDLHLTNPGEPNHKTAEWAIDEINTLIRPDFVQFIGDNVQHAVDSQFELFGALRSRLEVPSHVLVGDHDVHEDPGAAGFFRHIGPTHGSSVVAGVRFIRLNSLDYRPVGFSPEQILWFQDEIDAATQKNEKVILFQHHYPFKVYESYSGPGVDAWREIVQNSAIEAIFTGHTHYGQIANDGKHVYITTRSIGDPEGGPPGFTIAYSHGDDLAVVYRSASEAGPAVMIVHPRAKPLATRPAHIVKGDDRVQARIWSNERIVTVRGRIDGGKWFMLDDCSGIDRFAPLAGRELAKGEHTLEVEATDSRGRVGRDSIGFMVDPTGRYTPIPSTTPVVVATAYC